jgi:hypothetical protein
MKQINQPQTPDPEVENKHEEWIGDEHDIQSMLNDEVARLRELLNRAIEILTAITWGDEGRDYDWQRVIKDLEKIKKEAQLAPTQEETQDGATMDEWYGGFSKIESTEPAPEWRELGLDEVICEGDDRTRRPLPNSHQFEGIKKQGEMPLEKEIKRIEWHQNYSEATVHHAIADTLRYLRDEVQKLKDDR